MKISSAGSRPALVFMDSVNCPTLGIVSAEASGRTATIQQRVTAVLRSIPKEAFADSFQKLYERCQPCVVEG
jgi:hypothetical protein